MDILYFFSNPAMPEGNELIAARRYDAVYSDSTAERTGLAACLRAHIQNTRMNPDWGKISIDLKKPYKFSIAAENARFNGYSSEKIITSMLANTIPIYFGDPSIGERYNQKSFINADNFSSLEDLVKLIEEIDSNDDLYIYYESAMENSKPNF